MENLSGLEIAPIYRKAHEAAFELVQELSEEQFHWKARPDSPSIAFHFWHLARWADYLQAALARLLPDLGPRQQIWEAENLAAQWGLEAAQLGEIQTGQLLPGDEAANLTLPDKETLLAYSRQAFASAESAAEWIDANAAMLGETDEERKKAYLRARQGIIDFLGHDNRHLGMMECLKGLQTGRGTATV